MNFCPKKHLGAHNELIACTWLLQQGYEVFRNVSPHGGDVDIIAIRGSETLYLDAKSAQYTKDKKPSEHANRLKASQIAAGVKRLNVYADGHCAIVDEVVALAEALHQRHCPNCGDEFVPNKARQTYCSRKCSTAAWDINKRGDHPRRAYNKKRR